MTPCARGCCWTAYQVCARQRDCKCHWADTPRNEPRAGNTRGHRAPTEDQAIRNVMRQTRRT